MQSKDVCLGFRNTLRKWPGLFLCKPLKGLIKGLQPSITDMNGRPQRSEGITYLTSG